MRLRTSHAPNHARPRDGYVIFAVLIVVIVLSLVAYRFTDSMTSVFWLTGGISLLAFLVLLLMPEVVLRSTSAAAAAAAERAAALE